MRAHKLHHKYSDTDKDPYTPTEGVWCSYLGWFLYNEYIGTKVTRKHTLFGFIKDLDYTIATYFVQVSSSYAYIFCFPIYYCKP